MACMAGDKKRSICYGIQGTLVASAVFGAMAKRAMR